MELFSNPIFLSIASGLCFLIAAGVIMVDEMVSRCCDLGLPPLMLPVPDEALADTLVDTGVITMLVQCCGDEPQPLVPALRVGGTGLFVRWECAQCGLTHRG